MCAFHIIQLWKCFTIRWILSRWVLSSSSSLSSYFVSFLIFFFFRKFCFLCPKMLINDRYWLCWCILYFNMMPQVRGLQLMMIIMMCTVLLSFHSYLDVTITYILTLILIYHIDFFSSSFLFSFYFPLSFGDKNSWCYIIKIRIKCICCCCCWTSIYVCTVLSRLSIIDYGIFHSWIEASLCVCVCVTNRFLCNFFFFSPYLLAAFYDYYINES